MVNSVKPVNYDVNFQKPQSDKKKTEDKTRILPNTYNTRVRQDFQKTSSAFLDYPVKGLKGDINSNFYEFLAMGAVPYVTGSLMFMAAFNCLNKHLSPKAQLRGKKFALGVVLYGVMKSLSKNFVTKPVKWATGVDTEMPYENIVYSLPKEAGEAANIEVQHQQRKVYDSKEFFRKDLLDRTYFDKIAQKLGLGSDLNDSISETTPIIQNIVATTNTAKSLASYCWAATGVALAVQNDWAAFFDAFKSRKHFIPKSDMNFLQRFSGRFKNFGRNTLDITKTFIKSLLKSCKELWHGPEEACGFFRKHMGKTLTGFTAILTAILTLNTIIRAKNMAKNSNKNTINTNKEVTVI